MELQFHENKIFAMKALLFFLLINIVNTNYTADENNNFEQLYLKNIKHKTLKAIAIVETNDGKNLNHKILPNLSFAIGKYGLMPDTIKYIIKNDKHFTAFNFLLNSDNKAMAVFCNKNKKITEDFAFAYYDMVVKELNTVDPAYIGYAWLNGIYGTKKILRKNVTKHWHVKKILVAFNNI